MSLSYLFVDLHEDSRQQEKLSAHNTLIGFLNNDPKMRDGLKRLHNEYCFHNHDNSENPTSNLKEMCKMLPVFLKTFESHDGKFNPKLSDHKYTNLNLIQFMVEGMCFPENADCLLATKTSIEKKFRETSSK